MLPFNSPTNAAIYFGFSGSNLRCKEEVCWSCINYWVKRVPLRELESASSIFISTNLPRIFGFWKWKFTTLLHSVLACISRESFFDKSVTRHLWIVLPILYCMRPETRLTLIEVHTASLFFHLMLSNLLALQPVFLVWQKRWNWRRHRILLH